MCLVIVTIDQRNVALKYEDARRVSSFNFMNSNMSIRQYMSNTCTRRPARIHYLNYATSVLPHATRKPRVWLQTSIQSIVKAKKFTFSCTFKIKNFEGGIIACTQRAGILVCWKYNYKVDTKPVVAFRNSEINSRCR